MYVSIHPQSRRPPWLNFPGLRRLPHATRHSPLLLHAHPSPGVLGPIRYIRHLRTLQRHETSSSGRSVSPRTYQENTPASSPHQWPGRVSAIPVLLLGHPPSCRYSFTGRNWSCFRCRELSTDALDHHSTRRRGRYRYRVHCLRPVHPARLEQKIVVHDHTVPYRHHHLLRRMGHDQAATPQSARPHSTGA